MAYVKIECSVPRNRKFMRAGPAPSWLWVCGLAYCQEGLTDGFIPEESLPYLGVKNAAQLAGHLVTAGLWLPVDGGWEVHDYLRHNRSAAHVRALTEKRSGAGSQGGRPSGKQIAFTEKSVKVSPSEKHPCTEAVAVVVADLSVKEKETVAPPLDLWLAELQRLYPPHRVTAGYRTSTAFCEIFFNDSRASDEVWAEMLGNLAANVVSYEWQMKGMAPSMEKYLSAGGWRQKHSPDPPLAGKSKGTKQWLLEANAAEAAARAKAEP